MNNGSRQPRPECPRCGYDQTGVVDSWKESCPLEGVCSECGLGFRWCDLLNPRLSLAPWSFEHWRRVSVRRWVITNRRALNPFGFWRAIRLEQPVIVRRLVWSIAVTVLLVHLSFAAATVIRAYLAMEGAVSRPPPRFIIIGPSGSVSAPAPPPVQARAQDFKSFAGPLMEIAIWPYGRTTVPMSVSAALGMGIFWGPPEFEPVGGSWLLCLCTLVVFVPPGFLVLGETFRRCRVRFVHLLRGAAYSLAGPFAAVIAAMIAAAALPEEQARAIGALCTGAAILWLCMYWPLFVSRYLRLTHAPWVALTMLTIAGLIALLATVLGWLYGMRGIL